jgi:hypothetical protein
MNHVTFETAKRLKEAMFPQPEFSTLQLWWGIRFPEGTARKEVLCVVTERITSKYSYSFDFTPSDGLEHTDFGNYAFAPTAVELLESLPPKTLAGFNNGEWSVMPATTEMVFTHRNPAEAAAMAWLALNKKI